jgi:hypothetical protein
MTTLYERAMDAWRTCRDEYDLYLEAQVERAEAECRGYLLNERGRALCVDPASLFMGTRARAYAYASEELKAWWGENGRLTFAEFEAGWPYDY